MVDVGVTAVLVGCWHASRKQKPIAMHLIDSPLAFRFPNPTMKEVLDAYES
jgi:hypothetical protein